MKNVKRVKVVHGGKWVSDFNKIEKLITSGEELFVESTLYGKLRLDFLSDLINENVIVGNNIIKIEQ